MQGARKYISDFYNISIVTPNISAIFVIYRLTDIFRHFSTFSDNQSTKKIAGINPAISYYLRNSAPNFSSTAVNTRLCASVTSSSVNVRSGSK